ncbi:hypothetical protein PJK54_11795 [Cobetia sp. MMG027]|uniref:hypothetical protein n=1 Tax=Cobetia sp. MMG027 TaxID=3021980 RepID=UPI0022FE4F78|nr:hypothetical protein [Cobetia sp. MMG027]MDA5564346.1 hypothetical protein [Cobetia sp. MMG027]
MWKFTLGVICGLLLSYLGDLKFFSEAKLTDWLLVAVGFTTVCVYFMHEKGLKRDRIWNTNKDSLMKLRKNLADAIYALEYLVEEYRYGELAMDFNEDFPCYPDLKIFRQLQEQIEEILVVNSTMLDSLFVNRLLATKESLKIIRNDVNVTGALDNEEGYESELELLRSVEPNLNQLIIEMSGVERS